MFNGQPPRGSELTAMRFRNGALQDRNQVVLDGIMMTIIRYYKSMSQWDSPKVIPRFLPARLGQLAAIYLAYVQPFAEYLQVKVLGGSFSDYIWADSHGPWGTDRLTRALKRETGKRLGVALNTREYRHVAVGIGRVVIGESFSRGYQDEVGEEEEPEAEDESPLELQNSRTTATGVSVYSVPIDIVKHLSNRSIETFRPLSEAWHNFLGLGKQLNGEQISSLQVRQTSKRQREPESAPAGQPLDAHPKRAELEPSSLEKDIKTAMQHVLKNSEVSFKSAEQEQAMHAVVQGQTPLVVVLPTGGGKSLLFTVPASMPGARVTILVVPFRALIEDHVQRISQSGVACAEWTQAQTHYPTSIVVVSADVAGSPSFLQYAILLNEKKLLQRVVIDECHLVVTSSHWRPKLATLRDLRMLSCPIVLLTATLPPVLEGVLAQDMLMSCATYIRASTVRPNIRYFVSWCAPGKAMETALATSRRQMQALRNGKRGVIYCRAKAQCEELADALQCACYHAGVHDRAERLEQWIKQGGLIVATSALGTGVDIAGIVLVLHVGMPWSMIDYCQESGRAGRSGEVANSVIIVEQGEVERQLRRSGDSADVCAMSTFIQSDGCRRGCMSEYMDGKRIACNDIESAGCDRCGEGQAEWQQSQSEAASGWQEVEEVMSELRAGCVACWVLGNGDWQAHKTMQCEAEEPYTGRELDRFRRGVRDSGDCHSCRRCWVSQRWCATGQDINNKCQWPNVVIPLVRVATGIEEGLAIVRQCGFQGDCEKMFQAYQTWLGRRSTVRIWGESMSNAMVVAVQVIQKGIALKKQ